MSSGQVKSFSEYVPDFQRLSELPSLSYREQLLPLIKQCSPTFFDINEPQEEVRRAAQATFRAVYDIFVKFGKGFTEGEQKGLLSFSIRSLTNVSAAPKDVLSELEPTAVAASLAMARLAEKALPQNLEEMCWEFNCIVIPLAIELIHLDLRKAPFGEAAELSKQFLTLVLRHTATCEDVGFGFLCLAAGTSAATISSSPGKEAVIICHWEETLESLVETIQEKLEARAVMASHEGVSRSPVNLDAAIKREERVQRTTTLAENLCSQLVVERLAKITSAIGRYLPQGRFCLTREKAKYVHLVFDALDRIIAIRFRYENPTLEEKQRILHFRTTALKGFCTIYPALPIERYEQGAAQDPALALPLKETFQAAATGIQEGIPEAFPLEQFLAHYGLILSFALQHYTEIKVADLEESLDGLLKAEARWHKTHPVDQISNVWSGILTTIREYAPPSAEGLQSLFELLSGYIRWTKAYEKEALQGKRAAVLEAADALDKVLAARTGVGKKKFSPQFRPKILSALDAKKGRS